MAVLSHIADATELDAVRSTTDDEIFNLTCSVDTQQTVALKLKRRPRQNLVHISIFSVAESFATSQPIGCYRAAGKRNKPRKIGGCVILTDIHTLIGKNNLVSGHVTGELDIKDRAGFGNRRSCPNKAVLNTDSSGGFGRRRSSFTLNNRLPQRQMRCRSQIQRTRTT